MASGGKKSGNVKEFEKRQCRSSEQPYLWATGWIGSMMGKGDDKQRNGALIVTNERVVFYLKGMMSEVCESIPLNRITSVSFSKTMAKSELTVHAPGNELEFKSLEAEATAAIREALDRVVAGEPLEAPETATPASTLQANTDNGPAKKGGVFKKVMLWSAGGLAVVIAIGAILPKKDDVAPSEPVAAEEPVVEEEASEEPAADAEPLAELSLADYLTQCQGAAEADFNRDCLGKRVFWVLWFSAGMEEHRVLMNRPGDYSTSFWVSFDQLPEWGERGAVSWTGRRVSVSATIAAPDDGIVLENASVIEDEGWRDRAVEMVRAREDVLDAMWPQPGGISFWVAMRNTGQSRDNDAAQLCGELWRAGRPADFSVMVTILDAARIAQQEEIGKARCSS